MSVQIRCGCGKKYRVADDAQGKRLRCKECGAELAIPRSTPQADDECDSGEFESAESFGESAGSAPRVSRLRRSIDDNDDSSESQISTGDLIVRGSGLFIFLATVVNCAYQFLREKPPAGRGDPFEPFFVGVLPVLVVGLVALYIAYIGEEPDPEARSLNRARGLGKCVAGIGMIVLGAILTVVVSVFLAQLAGYVIAFTGLILGGVVTFAYGGMSVLTGREFSKSGLSPHSKGAARSSKRPAWEDQRDDSDRSDDDDSYRVQTDRTVRSGSQSGSRSRRRKSAGLTSGLITLAAVAAAVCGLAGLAMVFWPKAKPEVADAKFAEPAPMQVPAVRAPRPAAPQLPAAKKNFTPVEQPAPQVAGGPPATPPTVPTDPQPGGPGMRRGFPGRMPFGPGGPRRGMPPTVAAPPATPGRPAMPGFPPNHGPAANPVTFTARIGGNGAAHSNTETSDKPLVGLRYELGEWQGAKSISYLKPIFDRAAAGGRGELVVARDGYVVGGFEVDADKLVDALRIIFVRMGDDGKIIAGDEYAGAWIGKPTGRAVRKVDSGGKLVVGIHTGLPSKDAEAIVNIGLALR